MKYTERKINEVTLVTAYSPETGRFYAIKQTQNGHSQATQEVALTGKILKTSSVYQTLAAAKRWVSREDKEALAKRRRYHREREAARYR